MKLVKKIVFVLIPVVLLALTVYFDVFFTADMWVCDNLYRQLDGPNPNIKMIVIDEETLKEYGNFTEFGREKIAMAIEKLSENPETAPAVIALDHMFVGYYDVEIDERLVAAVKKAGNVIAASNLVYRGTTKTDENGKLYYDAYNIEMEEVAFDELSAVLKNCYSNTYISNDGFIRMTTYKTEFDGQTKESFAYGIYKAYQEKMGLEVVEPDTNALNMFRFFYSGKSGEMMHVSLKSVLDGTVPASEFKDSIVFVGAYAPGSQDAYAVSVNREKVMYGVEIHANIVQALMEGKTAVKPSIGIYIGIVSVIFALFLILAKKQKLPFVIIEAFALAGLHLLVGRILAQNGYIIPQIYVLVMLALSCIYFVIEKYFIERAKRKNMLATFKKYVAPQVVEDISKSGKFELKLGGEKRNIACLFVDIRGFTPMSESLSPEQIVQILNEYLALTTQSIFKNNGTLDKFIGDATMAVFNAPFDLDDYVYKAVCTAWDIRSGSKELADKLMEKFGKTVSFGIGVNCGDAVVGNIGCDFRMDYTAIGDTVNTAARLESNAKPGEILISEDVYEIVKERIEVEDVGELSLKGKKNAVKVYRMVNLLEVAKQD